MIHSKFIDQLNEWGRKQVPFLFLIDFELEKPRAWQLSEVDSNEILYSFSGISNGSDDISIYKDVQIRSFPPLFEEYKRKFDIVCDRLNYGDSFLVNLTMKSSIELDGSLQNLFHRAQAKYKFWLRDEFLCYSPETFVQIRNGKIFSYPMKGTIDASTKGAERIVLQNKKELAEHITIVDLIRNDLSQMASNVSISRFRYLDKIVTGDRSLLQVSSEIVGDLAPNYLEQLGTILFSLLPAGSVSGAPKRKTCEIIRTAENEKRGYYTGVFGYFDGQNLDSGVAIRFIEQTEGRTFYRSGGGITAQSIDNEEYTEVIRKIYVPVA